VRCPYVLKTRTADGALVPLRGEHHAYASPAGAVFAAEWHAETSGLDVYVVNDRGQVVAGAVARQQDADYDYYGQAADYDHDQGGV